MKKGLLFVILHTIVVLVILLFIFYGDRFCYGVSPYFAFVLFLIDFPISLFYLGFCVAFQKSLVLIGLSDYILGAINAIVWGNIQYFLIGYCLSRKTGDRCDL